MLKIMIVDDSLNVRMDLRKAFSESESESEFELIEATDGDEAVALYKNNKDISLIICDYNMPGMDGLTTIKTIFAESPKGRVPCLMLTTESSQVLKKKGRDQGISGWLLKPFKKELLLKGVRAILANEGLS